MRQCSTLHVMHKGLCIGVTMRLPKSNDMSTDFVLTCAALALSEQLESQSMIVVYLVYLLPNSIAVVMHDTWSRKKLCSEHNLRIGVTLWYIACVQVFPSGPSICGVKESFAELSVQKLSVGSCCVCKLNKGPLKESGLGFIWEGLSTHASVKEWAEVAFVHLWTLYS